MKRLATFGAITLALVACASLDDPASQPQTQIEQTFTVAQVVEVERPSGRSVECVVVNQPQGVAVDCDW